MGFPATRRIARALRHAAPLLPGRVLVRRRDQQARLSAPAWRTWNTRGMLLGGACCTSLGWWEVCVLGFNRHQLKMEAPYDGDAWVYSCAKQLHPSSRLHIGPTFTRSNRLGRVADSSTRWSGTQSPNLCGPGIGLRIERVTNERPVPIASFFQEPQMAALDPFKEAELNFPLPAFAREIHQGPGMQCMAVGDERNA